MGGVFLKAKVEAKNVLEKGSEGLNGLNSFADNKIGWFKGKLGELIYFCFFQKAIILQFKVSMSTVSRRNRLRRGRKRWRRRKMPE